ncbi:hypothetical protein ABW20_dc0108950 [Dactylellina cionopaga]|nr:hypothetical protein ABW20_dc0108950 [Dactylellina cionopaga]
MHILKAASALLSLFAAAASAAPVGEIEERGYNVPLLPPAGLYKLLILRSGSAIHYKPVQASGNAFGGFLYLGYENSPNCARYGPRGCKDLGLDNAKFWIDTHRTTAAIGSRESTAKLYLTGNSQVAFSNGPVPPMVQQYGWRLQDKGNGNKYFDFDENEDEDRDQDGDGNIVTSGENEDIVPDENEEAIYEEELRRMKAGEGSLMHEITRAGGFGEWSERALAINPYRKKPGAPTEIDELYRRKRE